jgi:PAS domain S-box-containing protein
MSWLRFNAWPIGFHIVAWSLVPVVACFFVLAAGQVAYDRVQTTSALATDSRVILRAANELMLAIVDRETGLRGYVIAQDPVFLEPYQDGQLHVAEQIALLRDLVKDRPEQLARVNRVAFLAEDWIQAFAQPVIADVQAGRDTRPIVQGSAGKRRIDAIRTEMAAFEATETAALAAREAEDAAAWRLVWLLDAWTVLVLLISSAIALVVGRKIVRSVGSFAQAAGEIAAGNLTTRLDESGRNELAATGRAINRMAASLSEAYEELLAQNDTLVDQVRQAESARGELRSIFDATSDAIVMVAPDRTFRGMNRQFSALFGVEREAVVGRKFEELADLFDQAFSNADTLRARLTGTSSDMSTEISERIKQQWPACRDLALLSSPVRSENGEYLGRLYVFRDVTFEARLDEQRRQLEAERARAAEVQADLLPRSAPELSGMQLAGRCIPALQVGGDFFDWYAADGLLWLTLGDVMGKGMAAALLMATVRSTLRAGTHERSPSAALGIAQAVLGADLGHRDSYVTLLHAVYEPSTGRLAYVDAGHGHALVRRADGTFERLTSRSFPLGMPFATSFEEGELMLAPGDALILYSDGLVDAAPGVDIAAFASRADDAETATETVDRLIQLGIGSGVSTPARLVDDLTVVVLRAEEISAAVVEPVDERDRRDLVHDLVGPGVGTRRMW